MGFFDSTSNSSTNGAETGQQTADQSSAFSFSNIKTDDKSPLTFNIVATDYEAIGAAFDYGQAALDALVLGNADSYEFSAGAVQAGYDFAAGNNAAAFQLVGEGTNAAFEFVGGNVNTAFQFAGEGVNAGLEFAEGTFPVLVSALESAERSNGEAIHASEEARRDALEYGAGVTMEVLEQAALQAGLAVGAAENATGVVDAAAARNLEALRGGYTDALEFSAGAVQAGFNASQTAAVQAQDAFSKAVNAVQEASESETAALSEKMLWGLMALGAFMMWRLK